MALFADAIVSIDDSKFKAMNNKNKNHTLEKLQSHIARVKKHNENYLQ